MISPEVARTITSISFEIKRQIGLLINRNGNIEYVIVGNAQGILIPRIQDARKWMGRLLGLRLVHTHLKGENLTRDDLTDLALLRLDMIMAIEVLSDGFPGHVYIAYLLPNNDQNWDIIEKKNPGEINIDFLNHVHALEDEFERVIATRLTKGRGEKAVLVGVFPSSTRRREIARCLDEIKDLARSSDLNVMDEIVQVRPSLDPKSLMGKGKLQDLAIRSMQLSADVIVFCQDLSPGQLRYISEHIDLKVIDRTQLILDIFARHAHSRDGKLQVELAQLKYLLPRLVGRYQDLSRLRGGIGLRGPGETKLEIDRRRVRERIARIEKEIHELSRARIQKRLWRRKKGLPIISIIGYTNTGKSTLLNALTKSNIKVEDKLFSTLDPSSKRLRFPREKEVIITDTVGFIRDLPKDLVNAFRSTLEELEEADLLLNVVDISIPDYMEQMASVQRILEDMKLNRIPQIIVFNKIDKIDPHEALKIARKHGGVAISALQRIGLERLVEGIEQLIFK